MNARLPEKKIDSIRIDTGAKRIEVNDEGEYITLNFADQSLSTRFFAMADDFQAKEPEHGTDGIRADAGRRAVKPRISHLFQGADRRPLRGEYLPQGVRRYRTGR